MKFFIDLSKKQLVKSAASNVALERVVLKRRDSLAVEIVFVSRNSVASMPVGTTTSVALKRTFADSNFLALASGEPPALNLNTVPLEAIFSAGDPASIPALLEIRWAVPGETTRTATLQAEVQNSVILGTEATPAAIPDGKATEQEATAGEDNAKWMTPLRTAQAIAELAPPPTWNSVTDKPSTFPPSTHQHAIAEVAGLPEALDGKQSVSAGEATQSRVEAVETAITVLQEGLGNLDGDIGSERGFRMAADTALGQRIDYLTENLDPAALDSIAEAASSIGSLQTQINSKAEALHGHTASEIADFAAVAATISPLTDWVRVLDFPAYSIPGVGALDANGCYLRERATNIFRRGLFSLEFSGAPYQWHLYWSGGAEIFTSDEVVTESISGDEWPSDAAWADGAVERLTALEVANLLTTIVSSAIASDPAVGAAITETEALRSELDSHTHTASQIDGLSDFIIASAPGLSITTTVHTATGATDTYSVSGLASADPSHVLVQLNGVTQTPGTDYLVDFAGGRVIFDDFPPAGQQITLTALGLRTVQRPIDPTLYLYAFDQSANGLTTYSGRLLNADRPAAPALPESATTWTIKRTTLNAAGRVLATAQAIGSWANRESLSFQ